MNGPQETRGQTKRRQIGPVRRLANGMLDVSRKAGKHVKAIKANSRSPLLCVPPELRNCIWKYALGGHVFEVPIRRIFKRRKRVNKAKVWDLPKNTFALLRVCRQIYAETALLPYKHNAFRFYSEDAFDWAASLRAVQLNLISDIRIATIGAHHMLETNQISQQRSPLPETLHVDRFPGLRSVSFSVFRVPLYDEKTAAAQQPFALLEEMFIAAQELQLVQHLRKVKPDVRVGFADTKVVLRAP
ncbi:hypothetical protein SLS61_000140 [Didymella pomorum]